MTDKKYTDEEIVKVLTKLSQYTGLQEKYTQMLIASLDLINRQKAEIKWLNGKLIHALSELSLTRISLIDTKIKAYKEFAEKLKEEMFYKCGDMNYTENCDLRRLIDNLLKEMMRGAK